MIIIDPPVNAGSSREDIELWLAELERLRSSDGLTMADKLDVMHEVARAQRWLSKKVPTAG